MTAWAVSLWVLGLLTWVPYGTYHLLFHATRDQYALLITGVLFWIFGYWGVVGPLLAAVKVRRVFRAFERIQTKEELSAALGRADARDVAIDLIASENRVPRFIAARVYDLLLARLTPSNASESKPGRPLAGPGSAE